MATDKSAAVVTIKDAAAMNQAGARRIAAWLRKQADMLEQKDERGALSDRYRARYIYVEE